MTLPLNSNYTRAILCIGTAYIERRNLPLKNGSFSDSLKYKGILNSILFYFGNVELVYNYYLFLAERITVDVILAGKHG